MRTTCAVLVLAMLSLPAAAASSEKIALAEELVRLSHLDATGIESLVMAMGQRMEKTPHPEDVKTSIHGMSAEPKVREAVDRVTIDILTTRLSDDQLRKLVAFFKTDVGKAFADTQLALAADRAPRVYAMLQDTPSSKMKLTLADMRMMATATEAYATDANRYPDAKSIDELARVLSPTYVKKPVTVDAWGTPLAYRVTADHQTYRFASAGPDRKFDPSSLDINAKPRPSDDLVYQNGEFILAPVNP